MDSAPPPRKRSYVLCAACNSARFAALSLSVTYLSPFLSIYYLKEEFLAEGRSAATTIAAARRRQRRSGHRLGELFLEKRVSIAHARCARVADALDLPDTRLPTSRISLRFENAARTGGTTEMSSLSHARQSTVRDRRSYRARARALIYARRAFFTIVRKGL